MRKTIVFLIVFFYITLSNNTPVLIKNEKHLLQLIKTYVYAPANIFEAGG